MAAGTEVDPDEFCEEGHVATTKIGRHWRYDMATVDTWLRDRMSGRPKLGQ